VAPLSIQLFGQLDVSVHGTPIRRLRSRRDEWLLALLVLNHDQSVSREWLALTLWPFPDFSTDNARTYLRRSLWQVNLALGPEAARLLRLQGGRLKLELQGADVDLLEFNRLANSADPDERTSALKLCRGPFLYECREPWAAQERERLDQTYRSILHTSASRKLESDPVAAADLYRSAVMYDSEWSQAREGLMRAYKAMRRYNDALDVYHDHASVLRRLHESFPDPALTELAQAIRARAREDAGTARRSAVPSGAPAGVPAKAIPLPEYPTDLVGCEEEVIEVCAQLAHRRLITLTGPGGVGKTRLAVEVARRTAPGFKQGVRFIDLSRLKAGDSLGEAVIASLGIVASSQPDPLTAITDYLGEGHLLLVLDNCEHVRSDCARLTRDLLANCAQLRILATSRHALGLGEETNWRVPTLPIPPSSKVQRDSEEAALATRRFAAARLFEKRAADVRPGFAITASNAYDVVRICEHLDGIPLAIEIAAARLRVMSARELADRVTERLTLLSLSGLAEATRQRTLRATIDWSYQLLEAEEKTLLARLSVFRNGSSLEAIDRLSSFYPLRGDDVVVLIEGLVDKSLLHVTDTEAGTRYSMLETVRVYARERLDESGTALQAEQAFTAWLAEMAENAELELRGPAQAEWLLRVDGEVDNIRAAFHLCAESPDRVRYQEAWKLVAGLAHYWEMRGRFREGCDLLRRAVQLGDDWPPLRIRAWFHLALLTDMMGVASEQGSCLEERIRQAKETDDPRLITFAQQVGGWLLRNVDPARAVQYLEASLCQARRLADAWLQASILSTLAFTEMYLGIEGRIDLLLEEGIALARMTGDKWLTSELLYHAGLRALHQNDWHGAITLLESVREIQGQLKDYAGLSTTLHHLGNAHMKLEQPAQASEVFKESVLVSHQTGQRRCTAASLEGLAMSAMRHNLPRASVLYGAAAALRSGDARLLFPETGSHPQASGTFSGCEGTAYWKRGLAMSVEEAVRFALEQDAA
jgi:predicted ATPase/DNA-binding SARP family transcriptional activator